MTEQEHDEFLRIKDKKRKKFWKKRINAFTENQKEMYDLLNRIAPFAPTNKMFQNILDWIYMIGSEEDPNETYKEIK